MPDHIIREQQVRDSQAIDLIAHKVTRLAAGMEALTAAQLRMENAITSLVRIEERQITTSVRIDDLVKNSLDKESRLRSLELSMPDDADKRLAAIETRMPSLIETRLWVIGGGIGVIGMIGTALAKLVFK